MSTSSAQKIKHRIGNDISQKYNQERREKIQTSPRYQKPANNRYYRTLGDCDRKNCFIFVFCKKLYDLVKSHSCNIMK